MQQEGKRGGYYLAQQPDRIAVGSVIRMIDGSLARQPCASETHFRQCEEWLDIETCESLRFSRPLG